MNKYSKELAEMLGSDVADVISAWMNEELQKFEDNCKNNKLRDCSNDWLAYTVPDQTKAQTTKTDISSNYINMYEQPSAELSEINRLRVENMTLKEKIKLQERKINMLVQLLAK